MGRLNLPMGAYVSAEGWIVWNDEAYTREEWERRGNKRPYHWLTDEERATYHRDWMRRYRAARRESEPGVIGSLHSLACTGPMKKDGCVCKKIKVYDKPVERAA